MIASRLWAAVDAGLALHSVADLFHFTNMAKKIEKIGKVSSASVKKGSGRDWGEWISLLNTAGAPHMSHQDIVRLLKTKFKLTPWWQQGVTLGFELHIGRRIEGQSLNGQFNGMASRTLPLSQKKLWKFLTSVEGQQLWLKPLSPLKFKPKNVYEADGGIFGELRTMKAPERARLTWQDTEWDKPSVLNIMVIPRAGEKAILVFQHDALKDGRLRLQMKDHWKRVLDNMMAHFRGAPVP